VRKQDFSKKYKTFISENILIDIKGTKWKQYYRNPNNKSNKRSKLSKTPSAISEFASDVDTVLNSLGKLIVILTNIENELCQI
jgi:hypothetical protein